MLSYSKKQLNRFKSSNKTIKKPTEISSVMQEYCLKRSRFNPKKNITQSFL